MTWGFVFAVCAWSSHRQRFSALKTLDLWKKKKNWYNCFWSQLIHIGSPKWRLHNPPTHSIHGSPASESLLRAQACIRTAGVSGIHLEGSGHGCCQTLKSSSWNLRLYTGLVSAGDSQGSEEWEVMRMKGWLQLCFWGLLNQLWRLERLGEGHGLSSFHLKELTQL